MKVSNKIPFLFSLMVVILQLTAESFAAGVVSEDWKQDLCLGNNGIWRQRIQITIKNDRDTPATGDVISIKIGSAPGEAALVGVQTDALRLCNEAGQELLWAVTDKNGQMIRRGAIPSGSTLHIPADCPARAQTKYRLYFDNPDAWAVPDFLNVQFGLRNGGVEGGDGETPFGWKHDAPDAQHKATWVEERPHSGKRCLKTVVAEGAEPTWISTRQSNIRIEGGARYLMRAWVKAENVKGWAGWYIHVGNAQNYQLIGPMLNAGAGTYDWKEVRAEFTAPKEANVADLGTVLRGTGTAWFDDVSLEIIERGTPLLSAFPGPPERQPSLMEIGADAPWPVDAALIYRVPVIWINTANTELSGWLAVDLAGAMARLNQSADFQTIKVMDRKQTLSAYRLGSLLLFNARVEPRTRHTFHVYFTQATGAQNFPAPTVAMELPANPALPGGVAKESVQGVTLSDFQKLLESPANLVKNPSFESGDKLPDSWSGGELPGPAKMGVDTPGLFGARCARLEWPADVTPQWAGWRQNVLVEPGKTYLYAAWLRCQNLEGGVQLHAHCLNAKGSLCRGLSMTGAGPALRGNMGWTILQGLFTMPEDAATFQLHLTMQARGVVWHDGVLLMEINAGRLGKLEPRISDTTTGPATWPVNAIVKVFQDDLPPKTIPQARITAARNDYEPLQVALRSPRAFPEVRVTVDVPANSTGVRLTNYTVNVVGYVPIDHPTSYYQTTNAPWLRKLPNHPGSSDGWPGWWPDPLLPTNAFRLDAHKTQPVWVTIAVPHHAPAGDYNGKVRFTAHGRTIAELPFIIHVWDFALPDERHVKAIYDVRQSGSWWTIPGQTPEQSRREFWRFMAERRLCPDTVHPAPKISYKDGQVTADFAEFDKAAEFYFNELKLPHMYTPWMFYCFGWGHPPGVKFNEAPYEGKSPYDGVDRTKLRPEFKKAYQECLKVFWGHLKAKGWDKRCVLYISDEPFDSQKIIRDQMKALCDMIHEVDPSIPIYSSTWHHQPEWDGYLNVWGIGHYGIVPVDKIEHIRKTGARIWWTTDGQMCTDTPYCAVERLLPHFCFKYGAEAYEFWGADWLTYNPYEFGWHSFIHQSDQPGRSYYVRYPNGDGFLAYPGGPVGHRGPVSSVRMEQAREGCEDYEYLYLLRERINAAKIAGRNTTAAEATLARASELVVIPNAGGLKSTRLLPRPDAVLEIKEQLARAIEALR